MFVAGWLLLAGRWAVAAEPGEIAPTPAERRWAVLISVGEYESLSAFPSRDENMTLLKECLVQAGFRPERVLLMNNTAEDPLLRPTKANIENQLEWLHGRTHENLPDAQRDPLRAADEVLVAIALYGVRSGDAQYLCPLDCALPRADDPDSFQRSAVAVDAVRDAMALCPAARKLLLLNIFNDDPSPMARGTFGQPTSQRFDVDKLPPYKGGYGELIGYDERRIEAKDVGGFLNIVVGGLQGQADHFGGNRDSWVSAIELSHHVQTRPGVLFKTAFAGSDYPLSPVQTEPPPALTARYEVLMRLAAVLLDFQLNDPAVDSSSRAIRNAPNADTAVQGYLRRAAAHIGRTDFAAALEDSSRAEKPLTAISGGRYPIFSGTKRIGWVERGQKVRITGTQGDWIGVAVGEGDREIRGWLSKKKSSLQRIPAARSTKRNPRRR